ncbi:MAG: 3-deoxy-D-manno-octulosonate cytidylyltransferase [Polaromonas sp.]|nr:3-deoxy-D-manno-octulosonate cytidylyltransferase [Polaromonas sp.]
MSEPAAFRCAIVIPARYGSSRLPGKPLADIHGKPMIQHVYEQACKVKGICDVVVATDDQRVADVVMAFGGKAVMTLPTHASGTDRLVEVMQALPADAYINLQGDEPLVRPADVELLVNAFRSDASLVVGTLCHPISADEAVNPNTVKVVVDAEGSALYFSRCPIPYPRDGSAASYLKHVGVYGYRASVLAGYSDLQPSMAERAESLEQLRLLHAGIRIKTYSVLPTGPGVDTPEGLEEVRRILSGETQAEAPEQAGLSRVRLLITDVDGVLTDGSIYYDEHGESIKKFHVRDGLGLRMLEACGVRVAVISGRDSATLRKRVADLQISLCQFGVKDKAGACQQIMQQAGVGRAETACIGDDSIDLPAFDACGISYAVADAPAYIQKAATHVLNMRGGKGAVRELTDMILRAQGKSDVFSSVEGYNRVMNAMVQ